MPHKKSSTWFSVGLIVATLFFALGAFYSGSVSAQEPVAPVVESVESVVHITNDAMPESRQGNPALNAGGVDHSVFEILQQDFETPQDLTAACLTCHINSADEVMHTTHWTWEYDNQTTGQLVGKKNELNNFCVATSSNEPRCTSCHVGYGWADGEFDFSAQENVDCLVCHDTTGTYKKTPTAAGMPDPEVDLTFVAQNIGKPTRDNCLVCHAYGGGGDAVKHGDIDSSLKEPDFALDVHMDANGLNFSCTQCHVTENHDITGSRYEHDGDVKSCVDCHDTTPHKDDLINQHAEKLACQACHIPSYARGGIPTKTTWDWSTAGEFAADGSKIATEEYNTLKGNFTWEENVVPEYVWFNGTVEFTLVSDTIDPTQVVSINSFLGDINDPNAKIWPVKRFVGKQPYDSVNNTMVVPHLFGKDDTAFWKNFDWNKAIATGMESVGADYGGEYGFVETEYFWPITHMVAPASEALDCQSCHDPDGGHVDFAALGYSEDRIEYLVWDSAGYPKTSKAALDELVSQPDLSNNWIKWLVTILVVGAVFELVVVRRLEEEHE